MLQETSLDFKLVQRICLLQQALDQAMDSLADLQKRVEDHQLLESHLAQTEEYSNAQQKIILNLQQQLSAKSQWERQVLERVVSQVKGILDGQQIELERLRARIHQSQAEVQTYLVRLTDFYQTDYYQTDYSHLDYGHAESHQALPPPEVELTSEVMLARNLTVSLCSQLQLARQHIHELDRALTRQQITFAKILAQAQAMGQSDRWRSVVQLEGDCRVDIDCELKDLDVKGLGNLDDVIALQAVVDAQHQKITQLSSELNKQFQEQTQLKQRCQMLAAERDCHKQHALELQQENERLRNQLAQQQSNLPTSPKSRALPRPQTAIPQWRSQSSEPNPLFRFKPDSCQPD
jgi:phenylalanyl-tRNA synthetase alpha subunit